MLELYNSAFKFLFHLKIHVSLFINVLVCFRILSLHLCNVVLWIRRQAPETLTHYPVPILHFQDIRLSKRNHSSHKIIHIICKAIGSILWFSSFPSESYRMDSNLSTENKRSMTHMDMDRYKHKRGTAQFLLKGERGVICHKSIHLLFGEKERVHYL